MSDAGIAKPLARYSAFKRVGDFVFLSGIIAVDPTRAKIISGFADIPADMRRQLGETGEFSVDIRQGPILAQSWYIFDRIRSTMETAGGSMKDVFKLVQYFKDIDDFPLYSKVRTSFFPDEPPVSTIVQVSEMLPSPDILIEVEATAYLPR
ncbi:MAG TPA: RidA family protein [Magnetospirillaceae bacterium]